MRSALRICLLAGILILAGCMPAKKALGPSVEPSTPQVVSPADSGAVADTEAVDEDNDPTDMVERENLASESARLSDAEQKILDTEISIRIGLDTEANAEVQRYFHYYTHTHRGTMEGWLKRAQHYLPHIRERFLAEGLPEDLIYLPFAESGFNPFAVSSAGAGGMWQFMPKTGVQYGLALDNWIDERRDPHKSTEAAIKYLKKLYDDFGDWSLALAAYNAGEGAIGRALKKTGTEDYFSLCEVSSDIKTETKHYVPKFMALVKIARNLDALGFQELDFSKRRPAHTVLTAKPGTDLLGLARSMGMDWKTFRDLNPTFRKQEAHPGRSVQVVVPGHQVATAQEYLQRPVVPKKTDYAAYKIKSGDTWWSVAKKHKVSVSALLAANKAGEKQKLQAGQSLRIPGQLGQRAAVDKPLPKTASKAQSRTYAVQQGDTVWSVARQFNADPLALLQTNGLTKTSVLRVGQQLVLPGGTKAVESAAKAASKEQVHYRVREGDNLWSIASRFGVSLAELREWNKLAENARLRPGDQIRVFTQ